MAEIAKVKEYVNETRSAVFEKLGTLLSASFALVAGLAWNDAVQTLFNQYFPATKASGVWLKFGYAFIITILAVGFSYWFIKIIQRMEKVEYTKIITDAKDRLKNHVKEQLEKQKKKLF